MDGHNANLHRGRGGRIEGLKICEQIAQRIAHRLEDEGRRVVLSSIEILTCELANAYSDPLIQPSLFYPPRIETARIHAGHAARTCQQAQISSEIAAALPESRCVEIQAVLADQLTEIDVYSSPEPIPTRKPLFLLALEVPQGIVDILKIEFHTAF